MRNNISDLRNTDLADRRRNQVQLQQPRQSSQDKKETPNTKKKVQIFVAQSNQSSKIPLPTPMSKMSKIDSVIVSKVAPSKLGNYKLFNLKEGSFAFKDKQSIQQPEYKLAFEERDLVGWLKMQERSDNMKKKKSGKFRFGSSLENQGREVQNATPSLLQSHSEATLNAQKIVAQNQPPKMFELIQVRYRNDRNFPFRMLDEVQKVLEKSVKEGIKQQKFLDRHDLYSEDPNANELQRFLSNNESGLKNLVIYMFWIVIDKWFGDVVNFTESFVEEIKGALNRQYLQIYFGYLLRIQREGMDQILEVLPYLLAEIIRNLIQEKIKGHMLVLNTTSPTYILLISICFSELYGYEISELALSKLQEKYIISDLDRLRHNKKTIPFSSQRQQQRKQSPKRNTTNDKSDQKTTLNQYSTLNLGGGGGSSLNNLNSSMSKSTTILKKVTSNLPTFASRATMIQKESGMGSKSSFNFDVPGAKKIASKESRDMYRAIANEITQKWNQVESSEAKKMISEQIQTFVRQENASKGSSPNISPRDNFSPPQSSEKKQRKAINFIETRLGKPASKTGGNLNSALKTKLRNRVTVALRKQSPQFMLGGTTSDDSMALNNSLSKGSPMQQPQKGSFGKGVNFDASVQSRLTVDSARFADQSSQMKRWRSVTLRVQKKPQKGLLGEDLKKSKKKKNFVKKLKQLDVSIPKIDTKYEELYSLSRQTAKAEPGVTRTTKFNMMHLSPTLKPKFEHILQSQFGLKSKQKRLTIRAEPNRVLAERHTKMTYILSKEDLKKARQSETQNLKRSESVPVLSSNRDTTLNQKDGIDKVEHEIQKYMTYVRSAAAKEIQLQMQEQDAKFYGKLQIAESQIQNSQKETQGISSGEGTTLNQQGTEFQKRGRPLIDPTSGKDGEVKNNIAVKAMLKLHEDQKQKEIEVQQRKNTSSGAALDKKSTLKSQNSFTQERKISPRKQVRIFSSNQDSRTTSPKSFAATMPSGSLAKVGDGAHFFKDKNFKEAGKIWAQVDAKKDRMRHKRISVDKASDDCLSRALTLQSDMSSSQPILNIKDKNAFLYRESADDIQIISRKSDKNRSNLLSQTESQVKEIEKSLISRNSMFPSIDEYQQFAYNSQTQNVNQIDLNRTGSTLQSQSGNSKVLLQAHKAQSKQLLQVPPNIGQRKQSKKGLVTQNQFIKAVAGIKDIRLKKSSQDYELTESAQRIDERDLNRSLQKTQSRILRDSKTRISHDGGLKNHLQLQLVDYMKGKDTQESLKAEHTLQMEQFVKKRLQSIQPQSVRDLEKEKKMEEKRKERRRTKFKSMTPQQGQNVAVTFANQPLHINSQPQLGRIPDESVADKHTYTSLRKSSSKKTRNQFVFHEYEQKRNRERKRQEQIERQVRMEVGGGSLLQEKTQAEKETETQKLFQEEQFRKKRALLEQQMKKEESLRLNAAEKQANNKKLDFSKSNKSIIDLKSTLRFEKNLESLPELSPKISRNDQVSPTNDPKNSQKGGLQSVPGKLNQKQSSMKDSLKRAIQEMIQEKQIEILNDIDEKIDEREGINQFKGRVLRLQNTISTNFNIRGQGSYKISRSNRDLKKQGKRIENEQKAYLQKLKEQQMNDELDSEEENERFDQNQEVQLLRESEAANNPLAPNTGKSKQTKTMETNYGSKVTKYLANIDKRKKARQERLRKKGGLIIASTTTL